MLRVSLEQWRAFVHTARQGGFQKAATRLNKTPSALNHSIRKIEAAYGRPLFEANGRSIVLTHTGKMLLPFAEEVVAKAEAAERACVAACIQCLSGVGVFPLAIDVHFPTALLAETLRRLGERFPALSFRVYEADRHEAETLLRDEYVRLAITEGPCSAMGAEPILDVELACVVAADHPLAAIADGTPRDLDGFGEIRVEATPVHGSTRVHERFAAVRHPTTALAMLANADTYAWLPAAVIAPAVDAGTIRVLPWASKQPVTRSLFLARNRRDEDCEVALACMALLRDLAEARPAAPPVATARPAPTPPTERPCR